MQYMVGDIRKWDFQSDVFEGEYRIVESLEGNRYRIERLEPSDELIERATAYYLESAHPYCGYAEPYNMDGSYSSNWRKATRQEALDAEIMKRIDLAGTTLEIEITSNDRFASLF